MMPEGYNDLLKSVREENQRDDLDLRTAELILGQAYFPGTNLVVEQALRRDQAGRRAATVVQYSSLAPVLATKQLG